MGHARSLSSADGSRTIDRAETTSVQERYVLPDGGGAVRARACSRSHENDGSRS